MSTLKQSRLEVIALRIIRIAATLVVGGGVVAIIAALIVRIVRFLVGI
jgi:hypothetical protein